MTVKGSITDIRFRLSRARTVEQALAVLNEASFGALQDLQRDLGCPPSADHGQLRQRLAAAHVELVAHAVDGSVVLDTEQVTADVVRVWAAGAIAEWFPGYTDFAPQLGGQYRVRRVYDADVGEVFEVTTVEGYDPRRFLVSVTAIRVS